MNSFSNRFLITMFMIATATQSGRCENSFVYVSLAAENQIVRYELGSNGELTFDGTTNVEADPGVLAVHPSKKSFYAALRNAGKIISFQLNSDTGELAPINSVVADQDPCYLEFDRTGKFLMSAYYVAGKVAIHRLEANGAIGEVVGSYETADKAHAIVTDRSNRRVFVSHTGPNAIYSFGINEKTGELTPNDPPFLQTGDQTGPRHFAVHPNLNVAYCDNEQGSSVTVFKLDSKTGSIRPMQTESTLPENYALSNSCARMEIHPTGKFLYASNRGHDSIAAFSIDQTSGRVTSLGQFATEKTPRGFTIDPSGRYLIAAGEAANRLAIYRIGDDGRLARIGSYPTGKQPWWLTAFSN